MEPFSSIVRPRRFCGGNVRLVKSSLWSSISNMFLLLDTLFVSSKTNTSPPLNRPHNKNIDWTWSTIHTLADFYHMLSMLSFSRCSLLLSPKGQSPTLSLTRSNDPPAAKFRGELIFIFNLFFSYRTELLHLLFSLHTITVFCYNKYSHSEYTERLCHPKLCEKYEKWFSWWFPREWSRIILTLLKHSRGKLAVSALLRGKKRKEKRNLLVAKAMTLKQVKRLFMCDKGKQRWLAVALCNIWGRQSKMSSAQKKAAVNWSYGDYNEPLSDPRDPFVRNAPGPE